jgi:F-type H+-transporting ATPase subunit delta
MTPRAAATRYARALFDVALKEGDIDQVGRDIGGFADLVASNDGLARALSNPAIPVQKKRAVVNDLVARAATLSPIVAKLLALLAERDRLALLPEIVRAYETRLMDHAQVVRAELITAVVLPADRLQALQQGLAHATGRQVRMESRVDPSILGGAIARVGGTVYDGSVTTQLEKLKQQLIETEM